MSKIYRNFNTHNIKQLLEEIGAYRYTKALEVIDIEQKPDKLSCFYLEFKDKCIYLCYRYSTRYTQRIMKVDEFKNIPLEGWHLVLIKRYKK